MNPDALAMIKRVGGDKLVGQMISVFLDNAGKRLGAIGDGLTSGNRESIKQAAHPLKSSSGQMGATKMQEIAKDIEMAAAGEGDLQEIASKFHLLTAEYELVRSYLKEIQTSLSS